MQAHDTQISNYIESRLTRLETVIENINQNLKEIKTELKEIRSEMKEMEIRLDNKIINLNTKIDKLVYWMLGSILLPSGSASFIYIIKSLHWIT